MERVAILREGATVATFSVTVASSVPQRRRGLMNCPALKSGTGMLFVYDKVHPRVFWMKDTPLELAIIFFSPDGRIAAIEKGVPRSLTRVSSQGPVRSVLEINFTEARVLEIGDRLSSIPSQSN